MIANQNIKGIMVIGGMIYDQLDGMQQALVEMIEKVLSSKGYCPTYNEFCMLADFLGVTQATPHEMKTVWWEKYQEMVREIGDVLSGDGQ